MVNMTNAEYQAHLAKMGNPSPPSEPNPKESSKRESELQHLIRDYCKFKGWTCIISRMDKKTTRPKGEPDITIALPEGKVVWIETKAKYGKLSIHQIEFASALHKLGHRYHVVWSFREFTDLIRGLGV